MEDIIYVNNTITTTVIIKSTEPGSDPSPIELLA